MSILVIGSTGTIGTQVIKALAKRGQPASALIHETEPVKLPDGITPVKGDVTDMESMRAALSGIDTLYLLTPVVPDEMTRAILMLDLALETGIKRVVYQSMFKSDEFLDCPHANAKFATEQMIDKFEIPTTILRPNYFFQNDGGPVTKTHIYPMAIGNIGTSMVDAGDIGEIGAIKLIERDGSEPLPTEIVEIHGPDVITADSAIAIWEEVLGKEVTYAGDDLRQFEANFAQNVDERDRLRRCGHVPRLPAHRYDRARWRGRGDSKAARPSATHLPRLCRRRGCQLKSHFHR